MSEKWQKLPYEKEEEEDYPSTRRRRKRDTVPLSAQHDEDNSEGDKRDEDPGANEENIAQDDEISTSSDHKTVRRNNPDASQQPNDKDVIDLKAMVYSFESFRTIYIPGKTKN